jgi:hypothetical protein
MRSINSRNRNLGIQNARQSVKPIVRVDSDRPSLDWLACACIGCYSRCWQRLRDVVGHLTTVTRHTTTRVTGGASGALASVGSRRHAMCRLAAR